MAGTRNKPVSGGLEKVAVAITPDDVQRLEILSTAAPGVGLEFGNAMTVVLGSLEQLHRQPLDRAGKEQLQRAESGARQVTRLIRQALALARRESCKEQIVDLGEAVREMDKMLVHTAGENAKLVLELGQPLLARVDIHRLELTLLNLVRHAAAANAGLIVIRTSADWIGGLTDQPRVELSLAITGAGTVDASKEFDRSHAAFARAQSFVSSCGGEISIEMTSGPSTTIRLVFPRAPR